MAFLVKQYVFVNVKPLCPQFGADVANQHTHDALSLGTTSHMPSPQKWVLYSFIRDQRSNKP